MEAPAYRASPNAPPPDDRLDSWKEIAAYLKRDVTTVQRWEKREGMPVHRHLHDRIGSVYASRAELDAWARSRHPAWAENGANISVPEPVVVAEPAAAATLTIRAKWWLAAAAALAAALVLATLFEIQRTEYFWHSPIANAHFQPVTEFDGVSGAAAISRDGHLIAFLSDRDGPTDLWVTQTGSGEFHNLTHGSVPGLVNPSIRTLAFSPDTSLVSYWVKPAREGGDDTTTWAVPTLGGQPRPYLQGVAEYDWSPDGSRLGYHTSGPGDPVYLSTDGRVSNAQLLLKSSPGTHSHFPVWSPDGDFLYLVHGSVPDKLDIWRIASRGGVPEQITFHNSLVLYPTFLDRRTLLYLASDAEGSGPWLYSLDTERRVSHRLTFGPDRYTSLAASADGRHIVATIASEKKTLWRLDITASLTTAPTRLALGAGTGSSPRLGTNYLLYLRAGGSGDEVWKLVDGVDTQLWHGPGARILGAAISSDGRAIAFSVRQDGRSLLYTMLADGTGARVLSDSMDLEGPPAWSPDGRFITTAVKEGGIPHLVQVSVMSVKDRSITALVPGYSIAPTWSPDGKLVLYSGPDVGTAFAVKAFAADGSYVSLPPLSLTRGARHLALLPGSKTLVFLEGDLAHKNLWQMDLQTGARHPLTDLPPGFDVRDFDVSPDGREIVLERVQHRSEVVLLSLPQH